MRGFTSDVSPPVRPRGSAGLVSFATVATLAALLLSAVGLIGDAPPAAAASSTAASLAPHQSATGIRTPATASTASAAPSAAAPADTEPPSSTPSPPPTSRPLTLDTLPSGVVTTFPFTVAGSGTPGDVVAVSGGSAPSAAESCQATVDDDQRWSCGIASLPDGPGVAVRAEARSGGSDSGRVRVLHPPVIAGEGVVPTTGGVRGSAYQGASDTVTADTGGITT